MSVGRRAMIHRVAFGTGGAVLLLAFLAGAVQSLRSERRMPGPDLLVDGPANHIEHLLRAGEYDEAVRQLARYDPVSNDRLPHERLAQVLMQVGPEARLAFSRALRGHPGYANGHYQLGLAFVEADEYDDALREFEAALRIQPRYPEVHNALGMAFAYQGRAEDAAAQFWQALSLRPDYAEPRENLAKIARLLDGAPANTP